MPAQHADPLANEVPETRFGTWFQGTYVWRHYVVHETLAAHTLVCIAARRPL